MTLYDPPRHGEVDRAEPFRGGSILRAAPLLLAGLMLVGCQQAEHNGNAVLPANSVGQAAVEQCIPPTLALAGGSQSLESSLMTEAQANFAAAYQSACDKELLTGKPLIDPKATDQKQIFLVNAPEANVASIYFSQVDASRMVLEYPFLTIDGKSQVPSATELEEAIYCAVRGATPQEQEASGRCLVD